MFAVDDGLQHQPVEVAAGVLDEAARFVARRFEQTLLDAGHPVHVARAVLPHAGAPARAVRAADDLTVLLRSGRFLDLATAVRRVLRIVPAGTEAVFAEAAAPLRQAVGVYFDDVLVMDGDAGVRANRLGFLAAVRELVSGVLDWGELP
ncbi:hypothetical protein [Spirillospora sp. CA-294931]|uniref:hypothetical protein n=1 Tax=Spirillospora sp. CA-294931 TaxID=3240042 RepID=UPI003D910682